MRFHTNIWLIVFVLLASCTSTSSETTRSEKQTLYPFQEGPLQADLHQEYNNIFFQDDPQSRSKSLLKISYRALEKGDTSLFLQSNKEARELCDSIDHPAGIAETFWDLGKYYFNRKVKDSAYFYYDRAQKIYRSLGDTLNAGRLLLNMAIIQKDIKDYTGSEVTTFDAIHLLSLYNDYFSLYAAFNNLGIIFNELEQYERALYYHNKALEYLRKSSKKSRLPFVYNNIGVVHDNHKNYAQAIQYYRRAKHSYHSQKLDNPRIYAMILDNEAYAKLHLMDSSGVYEQLLKALKIRKKLSPQTGLSVSHLHIAEYFLFKKDTANAIKHAHKAEEIAFTDRNSRDYLSAIKLFINLSPEEALSYSKRYINVNDSLYKHERAVQNKFAGIRFETDEYISEAKKLNQRILRLSIISSSVVLLLILLYIIMIQRSKTELLKQRQQAGQDIFRLMLAQQKSIEEGREKEKRRISRELHDGILGDLFGVRLSLESLNNHSDHSSVQKRSKYLEELQKITRRIRSVSHKLHKDSIIDIDFATVLNEFIQKQPAQHITFQLLLEDSIQWDKIEDHIKINIYRIIQEAVTNIHKHSQATKASVEIKKESTALVLKIKDNGRGFKKAKSKGIGLKNIKKRSRSINGKFTLTSTKKGTILKVIIQFKFNKSEVPWK